MKRLNFEGCAGQSTPHKIKLALDIIQDHFGDITRDVAEVVAGSETSTLAHIVRTLNNSYKPVSIQERLSGSQSATSSLDLLQIRQALLVLHQHNCLHVSLPPDCSIQGDAPSVAAEKLANQKGLIYHLNTDNVLNRLRFSKVLTLVHGLFGCVGEAVMEQLILHGRLTPSQIRINASASLGQAYEDATAQMQMVQQQNEMSSEAALLSLPVASQVRSHSFSFSLLLIIVVGID